MCFLNTNMHLVDPEIWQKLRKNCRKLDQNGPFLLEHPFFTGNPPFLNCLDMRLNVSIKYTFSQL